MARRFAPHAFVAASRYLIVPCEADGYGDLAVIWDRLEEQVIDVIDARLSARYADEDAPRPTGRLRRRSGRTAGRR